MNEAVRTQGTAPRVSATPGGATKAALKTLLGTTVSLILATTGWSYGGASSYTSTVKPAGPRTGTSGTAFFNVEGSGNGANASFGVIDFNSSLFTIGAGVTAISNLTLILTESNSAFTAPASLNFYLSQDTTTDITPTDTSLIYNASAAPEGVGTELSPLTLLGTGTFTTTGNTNTGQVDTYSLTLPTSVQSYFIGQVNAGGLLRFVVTPTTSTSAATYAGSTNTTSSTPPPKLSFDATLNQPSLTWKSGSGTWNPAGTAGDTSWSGGPWQSANTAIFNSTGGVVSLSAPVTAVGMTFDTDGYTISGSAANSLTLTGGIVQVTNAGQTATVSAVLAGTVGVSKNGSGTLILSGQNAFQGTTTINGGTLSISSDGNLGAGANGIALNSGTLRTGAAVTLGTGRTLSGSGTLDMTGGALIAAGPIAAGALTVANGTATFSNTSTVVSSVNVNAGSNLILAGGVTNSGTAKTILSGDGSVLLSGDNSAFSNGFMVSKGTGTVGPTITLTADTSLGTGQINLNAGTLQSAANRTVTTPISLGGSVTIGGTTAGTTGNFTFTQFGQFGTSKKVLSVAGSSVVTISGTIASTGTAGAGDSFNKAGTGRLILTGFPNQYTGGTSVTGGTLEVGSTSVLGTGDIAVTALANAHVVLQMDSNSSLQDNLSNVILTSNGAFHGQLDLEYANNATPEAVNSLLIDGTAVPVGIYGASDIPGFILGTGRLQVLTLAVPEPSSWVMLGGGLAFLGGWTMRSRKRMVASPTFASDTRHC